MSDPGSPEQPAPPSPAAGPDRSTARALATSAIARGEPTAWFEELYAQADGPAEISWADLQPNPGMLAWLEREGSAGEGHSALVVGCGLGDDAEALAARGFEVTAFDIAPTVIGWARERFPASPVSYHVQDALALPGDWSRRFDFVFESNTLHVLPAAVRPALAHGIAETVAVGGTLLAIARGREDDDPEGEMPWPLRSEELSELFAADLHQRELERYLDAEAPPVLRLRASFTR